MNAPPSGNVQNSDNSPNPSSQHKDNYARKDGFRILQVMYASLIILIICIHALFIIPSISAYMPLSYKYNILNEMRNLIPKQNIQFHIAFIFGYCCLLGWNFKLFVLFASICNQEKNHKHKPEQKDEDNNKDRRTAFQDFSKDGKVLTDSEINTKSNWYRFFYRVLVAYNLELMNLFFGLLLIFEGVYLEQGLCPKPVPQIFREIGLGFFIAAVVSVMFEVQHRVRSFVKPVEEINALISNLNKLIGGENEKDNASTLSSLVSTLSVEVKDANKISGYLNYRSQIQVAYSVANRRIISITNAWLIDKQYWDQGEWNDCPLSINLSVAFEKLKPSKVGCSQLRIVYAGNVVWPQTVRPDEQAVLNGQFDPIDFERFLGVVWRLVIAHKLRQKYELSHKDTIRVLVASVPIEATVVDDDVFILLPDPSKQNEIELARGTKVAQGNNQLADVYEQMIRGYLRHSRSAREYVEAVLYLGAMYGDTNLFTSFKQKNTTLECLRTLGLDAWVESRKKNHSTLNYEAHAIKIIEAFLDMNVENFVSYSDMRRDLF